MEKQDAFANRGASEFVQTVTTSLVKSEARVKLNTDGCNPALSAEPSVVVLDVESTCTSKHLEAVQHEVNAWITAHVVDK